MSLPSTQKILLTGATGTLGFNVMRLLARESSHEVIAVVREKIPILGEFEPRIHFQKSDLARIHETGRLVGELQPDVIVHCAASGVRPPKRSWFEIISFNVETTLRLFEIYCQSKAKHFVYVSTGLVYKEQSRPLLESDPIENLHPYGASKAAADLLLQAAAVEFNRSVTIVRPFAFTGVEDAPMRLFPGLLHAAAEKKPFPMTSGKQVRDFCAVEDIARAIVLCIERQPRELIEKFNLGSGLELPVHDLVTSVCSDLGLEVDIQFGANPHPPHEPMHLVADISKAERELGWSPSTRLSYAVWELAQQIVPQLQLREPERKLCHPAAN
jgi:nucleoside-diphosphate-sugar epimerase